MLCTALKVIEGKHSGKIIPLEVGKFIIGREHDCHLRPNSEMISRHHCVFQADEFTVRLRDLGSTNGTFVNGKRIQTDTVLQDGDTVHVGKLAFQVAIKHVEADVVETSTSTIAAHETDVEVTPVSPIALDDSTVFTPDTEGGSTVISTMQIPAIQTPPTQPPPVQQIPVQQPPQPGVPIVPAQTYPQQGYPAGQIPYPQQQGVYQQQPGIAYPQQQQQQPMPVQQPPLEQPPQAGKIPVPPVKLPPPPGAE